MANTKKPAELTDAEIRAIAEAKGLRVNGGVDPGHAEAIRAEHRRQAEIRAQQDV